MSKTKHEHIQIIPLGGLGEIGKNMTVIEVDEQLFIIDVGLKSPETDMLGIDIVVPDFQYVMENRDRVRAIFLTHGHDEAIGGLSYLLRRVRVPVYGSALTTALAKDRLKEQDFRGEADFRAVHSDQLLTFDGVKVSFFQTAHTIPGSFGVAIHTSEGAIVHTGDFKFDQSAKGAYEAEMGKMAVLGQKGVLCLLSDSLDAERPGHAVSEATIAQAMVKAFSRAEGRVIVSSYASNVVRLQQVLESSIKTNRKVAIVGRTLLRLYETLCNLGYLSEELQEQVISLNSVNEFAPKEVCLVVTGHSGEPLEALQRMARGQHKLGRIQTGDTVVMMTPPNPGNELVMMKTIDALARAGAEIVTGDKKLYATGHGSQEDLKLMINLLKPKIFIPVQGEDRHLRSHARIAEGLGIPSRDIYVLEKGDRLLWKDGVFRTAGRVQAGNTLIDGSGVGDIGNIVLRDRRLLSQDGIFIVVVTLDRRNKKIISGPELISRGFVYVRESEQLMTQSEELVKTIVEQSLQQDGMDWSTMKQNVRDQLYNFLFERTKRRPMILPIIMEVSKENRSAQQVSVEK
ncbi:ribonuclease J [Mangrovibacillus cuniculi]|uniref:Ribonuclease J n=1 Tax=Mangrovibacillus cuniculi TaxID=2593652 RepID=A0A7S8CAG6_9BACI|nr:ribonuclease J [Mangrovibacillus cuniculi]QPC46397.1 ribonuclease J [Mangrovibacillus cuniculi]